MAKSINISIFNYIDKMPGKKFYLEKFYNSNEEIQMVNPQQEWFFDDSWGDSDPISDGKSWWIGQKNGRTRIDAEYFKYNKDDDVWEGSPTMSDNPSSFRINVATTNDKAWDKEEQMKYGVNWKDLAQNRGYIIGPEDFRNFEATIYWKRIGDWKNEPDDPQKAKRKCKGQPDQMTIYGRGGLHGKGWKEGCLGCCYKGSIDYNLKGALNPGSSYFEKEYHHYGSSEGYSDRIYQDRSLFTIAEKPDDDLTGTWMGKKFLLYDTNEEIENGIFAVRSEIWIDKNAEESIKDLKKQKWELMNVFIDRGDKAEDKYPPKDDGLAEEMVNECSAFSKNQIFAWGGPIVSFRIDCTNVQIKYASIRQIEKPKEDLPLPRQRNNK
jgi:hypothetical protein